jgi:uncharacterized membrane protein required for colicin V production
MSVPPSIFGLNGIDFLMAIVISLSVYIRRKDGIVAELFKLFGVFCTVFITLHYYVRFADFLRVQFFGKEVSTEFFAFCVLSVLIFLTFAFISSGWSLIVRIKSFEIVDRCGNFVLSLVRGYLICSMIFLALIITGNEYFVSRAKNSVSRTLFQSAAAELYRVTYKNFVEKLFPHERMNGEVFKLIGKESVKAGN